MIAPWIDVHNNSRYDSVEHELQDFQNLNLYLDTFGLRIRFLAVKVIHYQETLHYTDPDWKKTEDWILYI